MVDVLLYVLLFALFVLAALAAYWVLQNYLGGQAPKFALFGARAEKRLAVVEHASLDGRRRLVLVRRDNVEHLIMTGGPVDVVIETGIGETASDRASARLTMVSDEPAATAGDEPPVFGRQRTFGRAPQPIAE